MNVFIVSRHCGVVHTCTGGVRGIEALVLYMKFVEVFVNEVYLGNV